MTDLGAIFSSQLPQLNLANDALRGLICLIEGDSSLFIVEPTRSIDIIDLKELIKEKGINTTEHAVLAKDLILWKVRLTMASDSTTNPPAD